MQTDRIDPGKPVVALTFDDGPSEYTSRILNTLQQHGGRVSFFVTGSRIADHKNKVFRAHQMECEIICHAWDHPDFTALTVVEIMQQVTDTINAIEAVTGSISPMFRPPYGYMNKKVLKAAKKLELAIVNWSVDPRDWEHKDAQLVLSHIMDNIKSGDIVLCHDLYESTADAMDVLIPELIKAEVQLVTVSELLHHKYGEIEPGKVYPL
ncbi:MAG: polysaccharide deacetylase family protein [Oscillospiraceae bacterium]|nr:polysaccharide deacetylase family protein [Oscillospiraceae bacterium]